MCLDWPLRIEFVYLNECSLNNVRVLETCGTPRRSVSQIKFLP
jgi:hypothetical protein